MIFGNNIIKENNEIIDECELYDIFIESLAYEQEFFNECIINDFKEVYSINEGLEFINESITESIKKFINNIIDSISKSIDKLKEYTKEKSDKVKKEANLAKNNKNIDKDIVIKKVLTTKVFDKIEEKIFDRNATKGVTEQFYAIGPYLKKCYTSKTYKPMNTSEIDKTVDYINDFNSITDKLEYTEITIKPDEVSGYISGCEKLISDLNKEMQKGESYNINYKNMDKHAVDILNALKEYPENGEESKVLKDKLKREAIDNLRLIKECYLRIYLVLRTGINILLSDSLNILNHIKSA